MIYKKTLYKSTENNILTGVASGIGEYLDVEYSVIRAMFIILTCVNGIGIILYIALSILLPKSSEVLEQEDNIFHNYDFNKIEIKKNKLRKYLDILYNSIFNINILASFIIILGFLSLKFNIIPWNFIPEFAIYPTLILTLALTLLLKSINK